MPKTAYLAKHFSSSELKEKYLKSQNSVEMRRWHLLWKISLGWTIKNSAIAVGCSYPYAQKILHRYNLDGEEGVKNRKNQTSNHVRGKKRLLSQPQLEKLTRAIENKPADGGIWTGTKVARWIEKETGRKKVWNQRGWDYLKKCDYSWQSPRPREFDENFSNKEKAKTYAKSSVSSLSHGIKISSRSYRNFLRCR